MNYLRIKVLLIISVLGLLGCDSFVDVNIPSSQLTGSVVFKDKMTVNAAMSNIYSKLRDNSLLSGNVVGSGVLLGHYADELTYYGLNDENTLFVFNNTLLPTTSAVLQTWRESYYIIYCANAVIEGCQNATELSTTDKNLFIGEATFVRALMHFYLMNLYGEIPYVTSTNYETNRIVERSSTLNIYEKVIADLTNASAKLPETYVSAERVRPNRFAALALLARVYLYKGDWAAASAAASAVLNSNMYVWENDVDKVFLKGSTSTIWQFAPKLNGNNTDEATAFIFQTGPPSFRSLSPILVNSFESSDLRKTHWIQAISNGTGTWYYANKYKKNTNTGTSVEYSIVFRLAEQYLIRAEARAKQAELAGAKDDLNKVRNLAGLTNTLANSSDEILTAILNERKFEFFTEYGHRFFDLKRTGDLDRVLPITKSGWQANDKLWPIPEAELLTNRNLTQNPGY